MILTTQTDYIGRTHGDLAAVEILADAGFDALDYTMFSMRDDDCLLNTDAYMAHITALKAAADRRGIPFRQAHAPFPSSKADAGYNQMMFDRITRSIEIAGMLGVKSIVVHPMHHLPYDENAAALKAMNMGFYRSLVPYAKAAGVKIALENMWQRAADKKTLVPSACSRTREFADWLDTLADDTFTACLDLGHCGLYGFDAAEMIKGLGKARLGALHVHDNDYQSDMHTIPFLGKMHWDTITDALVQIGYTGDLTLEADNFYTPFGAELAPASAKMLAAVGRRLITMIEEKQTKRRA